jgi:hypothetical protein
MIKFIVAELVCGEVRRSSDFRILAEVALCRVHGFDVEFPLNGSHCFNKFHYSSMNWIVEDIIPDKHLTCFLE